tara:strand:- start:95 stop:565 length:471 start_codon:yes stop_codon:yes gene_type:complete
MTKVKETVPKGTPIIIPGAEHMTKEELAKAKKAESQRRLMQRRRGKEPTVKQTNQEVRTMDTKEMVNMAQDTRNLAIQALNMKLGDLMSDPEQLAKANITQLATTFGILFDKAQLAAGLSTENISIQAKIDVNMSADEAIETLNKMREHDAEVNTK